MVVIPKSVKVEMVPVVHSKLRTADGEDALAMLSMAQEGVEKPMFPRLKLSNESS
jgi:hypothetical protein